MPSSYSSSLRLELQASGENANTWGTKTNNNLNLIEQAIAGYTKITLTSASATYNLTIADASASEGRNAFIEFAGTVASAISIVVPDAEKGYWVRNSATGSPLTFRTSSGTGLTLPTNEWVFLIADGTSVVSTLPTSLTNYARLAAAQTFTNANTFTSAVTLQGPVSITGATVITSATDIRANLSVTGTTNLAGNVVVSGATTLASVVDIKGATSLASTLVVGGATDIRANLSVTGSTNLAGNVLISGNVSVSGSFAVSGASTFNSVVNIRSNASITGNFLVSGETTLASAVTIKGPTSLASTLVVNGTATFNGVVSITGTLYPKFIIGGSAAFIDNLDVGGRVDIHNNVSIAGALALNSTFTVSGASFLTSAVTITGPTSIANTLRVQSTATFDSNVSVSGSLGVFGAATFSSAVSINTLTVSNNATLNGNVSVSGTFTAKSATSIASTLVVNGATTFNSNVSMNAGVSVSGTFVVNGSSTFRSPVSVSGSLVLNGNLGRTILSDISLELGRNQTFGQSEILFYTSGTVYDANISRFPGYFEIRDIAVINIEAPSININSRLAVTSVVQVGTGTPVGGSDQLLIFNGVAPVSSVANGIILYAQDVAASSELKVRDEAGNITTLSPHNFSLCGGPSEEMAWSYYSEKDGKAINIDMMKLARLLEKLTGEKLVYIGDVP